LQGFKKLAGEMLKMTEMDIKRLIKAGHLERVKSNG